jgi:hypothetical protein
MKHMNSQWDALDKILLCQTAEANTAPICGPAKNGNFKIEHLELLYFCSQLNKFGVITMYL